MKRFVVAILLLAARAYSQCAAGTMAYYTTAGGSLSDICGNYGDLVKTGSPPAVSSPIVGYGPFASTEKLQVPAALNTAMQSLSVYTIILDRVYINAFNGNEFPWSMENGANDDYYNVFGASAGAATIRWVSSGGGSNILDSAAGLIAVSTTVSIKFVSDGTNKLIYLNDALVTGTAHVAGLPSTIASPLRFGAAWPPSSNFPLSGFIGGFRIMNVAAKSPVVDSSGSRSPFWENLVRPRMTKPFMPGFSTLFDLFFSTRAYAVPGWQQEISFKDYQLGVVNAEKQKAIFSKPSPTPTETPGKSGSPTPTSSPTVSPTATPTPKGP